MDHHESAPEIRDLERTAEHCMRRVDANPADRASAAAAEQLLRLASHLRQPEAAPLLKELHALTNWIGESGNTDDFADLAEAYRRTIGVTHHPADGEAYLRTLIDLARQTSEGR